MQKLQVALIAILIVCVTFVSCSRDHGPLEQVTKEIMGADDMMAADDMMDMTAHTSWMNVALAAPGPAADATSPAETGGVHGLGTRTVYINDIGVMANEEGTEYLPGTVIVKEIMDDANTFVAKIAKMTKTDDPMYADHDGWMYVKYARMSADGEYAMVGGGSLAGSTGCHGCHAKADNDSVFVSLSMDGMADDMIAADDTMAADDMMDMAAHASWMNVALAAPGPAADATSPAETGGVHGLGTRTVYINDIGVMANEEETEYPAGTVIVKEIMDDANTFVAKIAKMTKTDDPMYADHDGWMYVKYARMSADGEYAMVGGGSLAGSIGCHGCHANADNDSVFVSLSMADGMADDMMDDGMDDMDDGAGAGDAQ